MATKVIATRSAFDDRKWWKEAVVYQVWPHSFKDSNGDGIGDLQGIRSKLDHIQGLGVDVIWISPLYKSPFADSGYDISDYQSINELYGTLDDWQQLVDDVHSRGMKLVMDLVVNHTSAEHPWFVESRSSKTNPKRHFYHWQKPRFNDKGERCEPNNWQSAFSSNISAWQWDEATGEYYLQLFNGAQPDLNWESPEVRDTIFEMMRWWFKRGIDGFRMDVICMISKVPGYPDAPVSNPNAKFQDFGPMVIDGPNCHAYLKEMHEKVLQHYDEINVGEFPGIYDPKKLSPYVVPENKELKMLFLFEHIEVDGVIGTLHDWKLPDLKKIHAKWQTALPPLGAWNSVYIQNHDHSRCVSRFTDDSTEHRVNAAKMLATMEATLSGTLYIYQGEEIGMINAPKSWPLEEYRDVATIDYYHGELKKRQLASGKQEPDMSDCLAYIHKKARDHARTPVQWSAEEYAGFSTVKPWMRVNDCYKELNVAAQEKDRESTLSYWKGMVKFRKENSACTYGEYNDVDPTHEQVYAYTKQSKDQKLFVVFNWSGESVRYDLKTEEIGTSEGRLVMHYTPTDETELKPVLNLKAYEARIYQL